MKRLLFTLLAIISAGSFAASYPVSVVASDPYLYNYLDGYTQAGSPMPTTPFGANSVTQTYMLSLADSVVGVTLGSSQISGAYLHIAIPNADAEQYPDEHMMVTCSSGAAAYDTSYGGFTAKVIFANGHIDTFNCPSLAYNQGQILSFENTSPVSMFAAGQSQIEITKL
jgi:hypothetical protein